LGSSKDVDHLLDVGLKYVPADSLIQTLISDIRGWVKIDQDWEKTRQRIEDKYGYSKFPGACHIIPNHGIMIMALIYGGDSFHEAIHIINTCGWDTDCNSGNVGCLLAIMHGISGFEDGPDWRGPLADRALISSADGGYSMNNAARIAYDIVNTGRKLANEAPLPSPKKGAQFHFSLPGSVQGFIASKNYLLPNLVRIQQETDDQNRSGLAIHLNGLTNAVEPVEVLTQTFTPPEIVKMWVYDLMASPLVVPGQTVTAVLRADGSNNYPILVNLRVKHYNSADTLSPFDGPSITLSPGQDHTLTWTIPDAFDCQPIQQLGLALSCSKGAATGTIRLESLSYGGTPCMTLKRPAAAQGDIFVPAKVGHPCDFWRRVYTTSVNEFHTKFPVATFYLAQDQGEGLLTTGTRDWINYKVSAPNFKVNLGNSGLAVRVQGLNRYYALMFNLGWKHVSLVKAKDETRTELATIDYPWALDEGYSVALSVDGGKIKGFIAGKKVIEAQDNEYTGGGIGAIVMNGSVSITQFDIAPIS
jgi:hypothetical protein